MTGIPIHPLRLRCLDRMKVLRVPFREQPPDASWFVGIDKRQEFAIFQVRATQYPVRLPYGPGEYFVREITWEPTSMIIRDCYYDLDINQKQFEALRNLFYKKIPAGRMNPDFARHYLTLGPPVPCRLGDVTDVQAKQEGIVMINHPGGVYYSFNGGETYSSATEAHKEQWKRMYPKHTDPAAWTWGYPIIRRLK